MPAYTFYYIDITSYVNCKPKDAKDDYQFSDHQYSVVRCKVPYEPEMNGMITIKVYCSNLQLLNLCSCIFICLLLHI